MSQGQIKHIHIVGERCSGTNFVAKLIEKNVKYVTVSNPHSVSEKLGWKHGFISDKIAQENKDCLFVHVHRNPYDQLRSFHSQPWHAHPSLYGLSFGDFIRKEWKIETHPNSPEIGYDKDPETGKPFQNAIELRTKKLYHFEALKNRVTYFLSVSYDHVNINPQHLLKKLETQFFITLHDKYTPVDTYKGEISNGPYFKKIYAPIQSKDLIYINDHLDWKLENSLGYHLIQKHQEDYLSDFLTSIINPSIPLPST